MSKSKIEWTNRVWNPVTGCTKVSAGCKNCYAETQAERFRGGKAFPNGFDLTLKPHKLAEPLSWKKPSKVFVNSMSDLFHVDIPNSYIAAVFAIMAITPQHTYQILTKRPRGVLKWFNTPTSLFDCLSLHLVGCSEKRWEEIFRKLSKVNWDWPLPNVWMGVSIESQKTAGRAYDLRQIPAAVRFISAEPLLEWTTIICRDIDWLIIGGESGQGARRMDEHWVRSLICDARIEGTKVFVKQMGSVWAKQHKSQHSKAGIMEEWPEELRVREFPE